VLIVSLAKWVLGELLPFVLSCHTLYMNSAALFTLSGDLQF